MDVSPAAKELAAEMWNVSQVRIAQEIANRHIKKAQVEVLDIADRLLAAHHTEGSPTRKALKIMRDALAAGHDVGEPILGAPLVLTGDVEDKA